MPRVEYSKNTYAGHELVRVFQSPALTVFATDSQRDKLNVIHDLSRCPCNTYLFMGWPGDHNDDFSQSHLGDSESN